MISFRAIDKIESVRGLDRPLPAWIVIVGATLGEGGPRSSPRAVSALTAWLSV